MASSTVMFPGPPGKVVAVEEPGVQGILPPLVDFDNRALTFQNRKSIITRIMIGLQTSHQFLHTLGGDIFIYVFGDRIGQMTISGVSMAYDCDQTGDGEHGIEKMIRLYNQYKLSARPTPVPLQIGKTTVNGFLSDFQADVFDHKLRLMQYNMTLWVLPEKRATPAAVTRRGVGDNVLAQAGALA